MKKLISCIDVILFALLLILSCIHATERLKNEMVRTKTEEQYFLSAIKAREIEELRFENEKLRQKVYKTLAGSK